jgi:hypothetical protein
MDASQRQMLDFTVFCPLSGIALEGETILPHRLVVVQAANKTLWAYCGPHRIRLFIAEPQVVVKILRESMIVGRKKENPNAATP